MADLPEAPRGLRRPVRFREAVAGDVDRLVEIETLSFSGDRLSRRSFVRLIASPSAAVIVAATRSGIAGYALVLFRRHSEIARLYSLAVDPAFAGRSIGRALVREAERVSIRHGANRLRLEVRADNRPALSLYGASGFEKIRDLRDYYADGGDGMRYEKALKTV
jgi:ribosomal protein S18 acetylase RimI-like enzyme